MTPRSAPRGTVPLVTGSRSRDRASSTRRRPRPSTSPSPTAAAVPSTARPPRSRNRAPVARRGDPRRGQPADQQHPGREPDEQRHEVVRPRVGTVHDREQAETAHGGEDQVGQPRTTDELHAGDARQQQEAERRACHEERLVEALDQVDQRDRDRAWRRVADGGGDRDQRSALLSQEGGGDLAGGEAGQPGEHARDEEPTASRVSGFARGRLGGFVAVGCGARAVVRAAFDRHRAIVAHAP